MNIMMSANDAMMPGLEVAIYSTMYYNSDINWYILTMDCDVDNKDNHTIVHYDRISDEHQNILRKIVKYFDGNSNICFVNCSDVYNAELKNSVNEYSGFTPYAALRLLADILFPNLQNILHLDCDTLIQSDLYPYYYQYTHINNDYAAYSIPEACDFNGEMVSGVLFFNLECIRQTGFLKKARENYRRNSYVYPDQMALRDANNKPTPIPETLNFMNKLEDINYDPVILHFSNQLTPKIYMTTKAQFYRRFPQFKYIQEGINEITSLNIKI